MGRDLKYAFRVLRSNPGFAAIAVLVLALGIGSNTAIFTVVDAVLLRPLPYPASDRLVMVWEDATKIGFPHNTPAPANYVDWRKQNTVFENIAALRNSAMSLTGGGEPEILRANVTTPSLFQVLGVHAALGRTLVNDDDRPGAPKVVVLAHGLWTRRFAGNPAILGTQVVLNDEKYTIVGVMPRGFAFPKPDVQLYVPTGFDAAAWSRRQNHFLNVVARLKPGVALATARSEMRTIAERLQRDYPESNTDVGAVVISLRDELTGQVRVGLWVLVAAVAFVLLIACANLANLLLARASARSREMAVRAAIGAGRAQIVRQLMMESAVVASLGVAIGLTLAAASLRGLERLVPDSMEGMADLSLDFRVLVFTIAIGIAATALFGMAPAWHASQVDLNEALKQSGRSVAGRRSRLRDALVIGEVAVAMMLLAGAGLMIQTLAKLRAVDLGFRPENIMTFATPLFSTRYAKDADRMGFMQRVLDRVRTLPGVSAASYASDLPLVMKGNTRGFVREGYPPPRPGDMFDANYREITPEYLATMGIRLLRGRYLDASDGPGKRPVAVINQTAARTFWADRDPIGKRFTFGGPNDPWVEIVGVVADIHQMGIDRAARSEMYLALAQAEGPDPTYLAVRSANDPTALVRSVVREIHAVDPAQPVARIQSMDTVVDSELSNRRMQMMLLAVFAGLALLLASVGVYGVLAFAVTQRTAEIGVRIALGARAADVLRMVAGTGLRLTVIGLLIGAAGGLALTRVMSSILFGIGANDPLTFATVAGVLLAVSVVASLAPAIRAARLDPVLALRNE